MSFQVWLVECKQYTERSARDVQSRLRRALSYSQEEAVSEVTLQVMEENIEFQMLSVSVKSQMRRAVRLFKEYACA